ncbi:SURF1 family protein [Crenobacter cavernae]|uniref:SURF1-like protein n=1 Tax=Crenobacter cavernae TaxID=2290923 RepID=A0ABY0FD45_9NEIS|nr:SURF1 family protein [Crenobacter cavernae]RXZ44069.1 SURF1 family protein [Crenobacter cavernae]
MASSKNPINPFITHPFARPVSLQCRAPGRAVLSFNPFGKRRRNAIRKARPATAPRDAAGGGSERQIAGPHLVPARPQRRSLIGLWLLALLPFALAVWQWQRGESRAALLASYEAATRAPVGALPADLQQRPDYRRVTVAGRPAGAPLWLANAWLGREAGVRQFQPLGLADGSVILIELGWLPANAPHRTIALPDTPLTGRWLPLPARYTLPGARIVNSGVTDAIDPATLAEGFGQPLRAGVVALERPPAPLKAWPTRPSFEPDRHYAYALQWLLIGLCLIVGCIALGRRRNESA